MMRGLAVCSLALVALAADPSAVIKMFSVAEIQGTGNGRDPQEQVADLGLGLAPLLPGARPWLDLDESKWSKIPGWLMGTVALVPSSRIHGTKRILWDCTGANDDCEIYTFMYSCAGCSFESGDFPTLMANSGFELFRCAPSLFSRTGGKEHNMIGYFRTIAAGSVFTIDITAATTEFINFGLQLHPSPLCDTLSEAACAESNGKCAFADGTCDFTKQCGAAPIGPGPSTSCTSLCINDDL